MKNDPVATAMIDHLLSHRIKRNPPKSQRAGVALAVRQSIAKLGPVDPKDIYLAATGIAMGLFGSAYDAADDDQKFEWRRMAAEEYRAALLSMMSVAELRALWDHMCESEDHWPDNGFPIEEVHLALNLKGDGDYCRV